MSNCKVSIIVISHNEGEYLRGTVASLLASPPPDAEILVIDDWSTDGSTEGLENNLVRVIRPGKRLGTVKARNFGARQAKGQIVVLSDAHVEVPERWFEPLLAPLANPSVGAVGPTITAMYDTGSKGFGLRFRDSALNCEWGRREGPRPYPVPLLGAGFFAMR